MNNILFSMLFIFISGTTLLSQEKIRVELSEGFIFYDYFGDNPKRYKKLFSGYGLQTELDVWISLFNKKRLDFNIGMGVTRFGYSYAYGFSFIAHESLSTPYMNLKLGINYKPKWSKVSFLLNSTNYFLLLKQKQQNSQNRWFNNMDIGLRIYIVKKLQLSLWSPVTLHPMHDGALVSRPIDVNIHYKPWIEITGLNLGISYEFGEKN